MHKVVVRYIDDADREDLLIVHPADQMRAKRELAGKSYADGEYLLFYQAWLAAVRSGKAPATVNFDHWLENVAEVEPRLTQQQVDDALLTGDISDHQADVLRAKIAEQEQAEGEATAPPS